ncbi:cytochrome c family protein [Alkalicaulis satelles]|uniref:Cytochrome c family protein n=1 Tax=Alkalicaulis satelles TaxID=2609175 RepID=A0A5M6ZLI0_9PROT|nr:cytochrome c family protein [Alkalicaulis satelles]KAA5804795.1 cytochrome c family protein [Alkalicaulis satelles]
MGDLFFNKVAGAILAVGLFIMALNELSGILFPTRGTGELAFPIDLAALDAAAPAAAADDSGPVDFGLLLAGADLSAGERVARRCVACHTFDQGGAHGTGPNMWNVMGRTVASISGFNYSSAMSDYGSDGTQWMFQNMYEYLENPRRYVPGTSMSFAGLRSQDDRINIIAYMRNQADDPIDLPEPLPEEPEAEAEMADAEAEDAAADMAEAEADENGAGDYGDDEGEGDNGED